MNTQCTQHSFCNCIFVSDKTYSCFWLNSGKLFIYYRMAVFMYWYVNLEVFMPYWNIEQTNQNYGKGCEMDYVLGLDEVKLQPRQPTMG